MGGDGWERERETNTKVIFFRIILMGSYFVCCCLTTKIIFMSHTLTQLGLCLHHVVGISGRFSLTVYIFQRRYNKKRKKGMKIKYNDDCDDDDDDNERILRDTKMLKIESSTCVNVVVWLCLVCDWTTTIFLFKKCLCDMRFVSPYLAFVWL